MGLAYDVTGRIRIEAALQEGEENYHKWFESMSEGFVLHEIETDDQSRPSGFPYPGDTLARMHCDDG